MEWENENVSSLKGGRAGGPWTAKLALEEFSSFEKCNWVNEPTFM